MRFPGTEVSSGLLRRVIAAPTLLACCLMLAACGLLPGGEQQTSPRPQRSAISSFVLEGRIAVRQGERHYTSNIFWRHAADQDEIRLATPLGQTVAELTRDAAGASLSTADRRDFKAADWETLLAKVLGVTLPLSALPRWLVGDVRTDGPQGVMDEVGRPQSLVVEGWRITYLGYEDETRDAMPTRMEFRREDIEVRLKIDEWQSVR